MRTPVLRARRHRAAVALRSQTARAANDQSPAHAAGCGADVPANPLSASVRQPESLADPSQRLRPPRQASSTTAGELCPCSAVRPRRCSGGRCCGSRRRSAAAASPRCQLAPTRRGPRRQPSGGPTEVRAVRRRQHFSRGRARTAWTQSMPQPRRPRWLDAIALHRGVAGATATRQRTERNQDGRQRRGQPATAPTHSPAGRGLAWPRSEPDLRADSRPRTPLGEDRPISADPLHQSLLDFIEGLNRKSELRDEWPA